MAQSLTDRAALSGATGRPHTWLTRMPKGRMNRRAAHRWQALSAAMPGLGVSLLVAAKCPACWLAYAGLLTMPGVAWLVGEPSLMLITVGLLGIALASLAYRAKDRRGYRPLALGIVAASLI